MCVRAVATGFKDTVLYALRVAGNHSGCHQMPERSFFYHGKQFPVCARCTGATIGQLFAIITNVTWLIGLHKSNSKGRIPWYLTIWTSLGSMGVMGADWLIQEVGIQESTNRRRLITGILGGYGVFNMYFCIAYFLKLVNNKRKRRCKGSV